MGLDSQTTARFAAASHLDTCSLRALEAQLDIIPEVHSARIRHSVLVKATPLLCSVVLAAFFRLCGPALAGHGHAAAHAGAAAATHTHGGGGGRAGALGYAAAAQLVEAVAAGVSTGAFAANCG